MNGPSSHHKIQVKVFSCALLQRQLTRNNQNDTILQKKIEDLSVGIGIKTGGVLCLHVCDDVR